MAKNYVVGFLFNQYYSEVVLIRKTHPEWQKGKLNGVGGKINPGEHPNNAMTRKFEEEAGLLIAPEFWRHVCTIQWPDDEVRVQDAEPSKVWFFTAKLEIEYLGAYVSSQTEEQIEIHHLDVVSWMSDLIPNLTWLLPLAAYHSDNYEPFIVNAETAT